ncbi:MAG: pyrroloquinoline quinone biosynthesis protein PqqE [Myxococcales bacterium]|nr:pyrroloquinoline quinone biosynthesis protein PqqE [Myxococcales bacterium]
MPDLPYTLIAELTYRCPLRCPYCSNPTDARDHGPELSTSEWQTILTQARELGVLQLHLTGGEPLARKDLEALVRHARSLDLYVNLVTSGVPLSKERLAELARAGLDNVQVSIQSIDRARSRAIAGVDVFDDKRQVLEWVKALGLPLTLNVVLHRDNLDEVEALIAYAEQVGADRLELANTQYLGWALVNREALLPARAPLIAAHTLASKAAQRLAGRMEVLFVMPDYHTRHPRACMDGWARRFLHIAPDGTALPCHAARSLPLTFLRAPEHSLAEIWHRSPAFEAFRGQAWMKPPCRDCERREQDFGGCRCQAFALTGDPAATDPACSLSPHRKRVTDARAQAGEQRPRRYLYRGTRGPGAPG